MSEKKILSNRSRLIVRDSRDGSIQLRKSIVKAHPNSLRAQKSSIDPKALGNLRVNLNGNELNNDLDRVTKSQQRPIKSLTTASPSVGLSFNSKLKKVGKQKSRTSMRMVAQTSESIN